MVALACYCKIVAKSGGSTLQQFCHSVCNGLDMWPPFSGVTACHPLANSLSMPLANKFLKEEALLFLRIHPVCSGKIFSAIAGLVEAFPPRDEFGIFQSAIVFLRCGYHAEVMEVDSEHR